MTAEALWKRDCCVHAERTSPSAASASRLGGGARTVFVEALDEDMEGDVFMHDVDLQRKHVDGNEVSDLMRECTDMRTLTAVLQDAR